MKSWLRYGFVLAALLAACAGGGGAPGGGEGPVGGGALDAGSGNYAAGPMSLPAPSIINKGLIRCDNIAGPTVECRGSDGAVPANSRLKLTVYDRFADRRTWTDWLLPTARAIPGSVDFCNANAAGAFGQTDGDCSVLATTGEQIGICIASGDNCVSPTILLTVPVTGGSTLGSSATVKAMGVTGDGYVITGERAPLPTAKPLRTAFHWTDLFMGTAQAADVPTIVPAAPRVPTCPSAPNVTFDVAAAYKAPADQFVTIHQQKGLVGNDLFRLPGTQEDMNAVSGDKIGNITYVSVAMKNTLYIVGRDAPVPMATIVFPAPIKSMRGGGSMEVLLQVPKGDPAVYQVAADSFDTSCDDSVEAKALTGPNSFAHGMGNFQPPGPGYRVPIPFDVSATVGKAENTDDYQVFYRQEEVAGYRNSYARMLYRQVGLMKDLLILQVNQDRAVMAVLDPGANRIILIVRDMVAEETRTTNVSLAGVTTTPVTMRSIKPFAGDPYLVVLDSGENGAKAVLIPVSLGEDPTLSLGNARSVDLGPIVADRLEMVQEGLYQWGTFDRVAGQVKLFVLGPPSD